MKRNLTLMALFLAAGSTMAGEHPVAAQFFANSLQRMCKGVGGDAVPTVQATGSGMVAITLDCPNPRGNPLVIRESLDLRIGQIEMEVLDAPVGVIKSKSDLFNDVLSHPWVQKYVEDGDAVKVYRWDGTVLRVWINEDGRRLRVSGMKKDIEQIESAAGKPQ